MLFLTPIAHPGLQAQESADTEELPELEMFIAEESAAALNDTVLPTDRAISGLFNDATSVLEVPRSVTLISPELMDQFGINDLDDLEKIGAGTQTVNYYGVAGAPTIRGVKGGTFINGMLRAYNRNEMPLSFGSLEAIEVVKGPAPADFTTTKIGGFVNLIPKSPFFDEEKGSIELELDNWGRKTLSADYGAPFLLLGDIPAAYRVSITTQDGESYYDDIYNDYTSVYGAIKFRPKDGVSVFLGGEYFDYKSNENAGWNRPTQELIDDGEYVIGEPLNATSGDWYGTVDRGAMYADTRLALTSDVAVANIDPALLGFMEFVTDTDGVDKYVYTQDYFDNGGEVVTKSIDGNEVLSDPGDYANSNDLILFGDIVFDSNPDRTITVKGLFEHMETEKNSSYGYAFESEQDVVELKTTVTDRALIPNTTITYGASVRYSEAMQLSDYWDEPFSRRDITQDTISSNTIVLVGDDSPIGGYNQWGRFGIGANGESEMTQLAAFLSGQSKFFEDRLSLLGSTRYEYADYDVGVPSVVDGPSYYSASQWAATKDGHEEGSGDTDFFNWSVGLNFELIDDVFLYANYQEGTSVAPSQAGVITSSENFQENNLWEVGIKASFFEGSLFTSLAYYEWEQSSYSSREATANTLEGEGVEAEITWLVTDHLTLIGSYTWQEVRRMAPLGYRSGPASEEDWALNGGTLLVGGDPVPASNTDLVYPGTPQQVVKLFGIYDFHNGFQVNGGVTWQEEFYTSFDRNIELPAALISSLGAKYTTEKWEVGIGIDNLTDEDYFYGSDPTFAANTLVTKAPERTYTVSFKYMF
ncbi:TonB-dependent receptor [Coraliomargarita sp. SDUM461003]|uniref:TonB-dependent receptor n=1 Tax=Thalassobacterium maritimum TaxID=3041265 RepID=A0ABU1AXA1_9BACT|nr:TonB-dependent receptor [Coraliomargarita sp. SDUM461003]MDQ8208765.1 TonB-dependent receptor [Coraliomargarita sp. SDUM461003]